MKKKGRRKVKYCEIAKIRGFTHELMKFGENLQEWDTTLLISTLFLRFRQIATNGYQEWNAWLGYIWKNFKEIKKSNGLGDRNG